MKLCVISFTSRGFELSKRVKACQNEVDAVESVEIATKWSGAQESASDNYETTPIGVWAGIQMKQKHGLLFIGACGIAVRAIAPYVTDKLLDSPVLVLDELGRYIIPILSGHMGGANTLALALSRCLGAEPVITTATDLNQKFAVDLFAKRNQLAVMNREGIAAVSSRLLHGNEVTIAIETGHFTGTKLPEGLRMLSYEQASEADILVTSERKEWKQWKGLLLLRPKVYALGMGCRRGKETEEWKRFVKRVLSEANISEKEIFALASIDRKAEEVCFLEWSRETQVPFVTFSANELSEVLGVFQSSDFVKAQVGVENVCERAAKKACGETGMLVIPKQAEHGMTIAAAKRDWSVTFDEA